MVAIAFPLIELPVVFPELIYYIRSPSRLGTFLLHLAVVHRYRVTFIWVLFSYMRLLARSSSISRV